MYRFKKGSGFPVSVPSVDLVEIGAGGGSLARIDELGLLKVGPESSGADPGPACYGRGGTQPAVTDADVLLGLLDPDYFLGGDMPLDVAAATAALAPIAGRRARPRRRRHGRRRARRGQPEHGRASRMHAVEQGVDLRGVAVIAFGGAGPVHACGLAELLDSDRVIFPVNASVLSAFGTLVTPVRIDLARSLVRRLEGIDEADRDAVLDELRTEGRRVLAAAGVPDDAVRFRYGVDARYVGQGNEITVWVGEGERVAGDRGEVARRFDEEYERIYGLTIPDVGVEAVTWRLSAYADQRPGRAGAPARGRARTPRAHGHRPARFGRAAPRTGRPGLPPRDPRPRHPLRRPGDRRGARDDRGDPARAGPSRSATTVRSWRRAGQERRAVSTSFDPIELEVLWQSLIATVNEQAKALQRAAFSPIVREAGDLANAVFDRRARMVAQAVTGTPGHINSLAIGAAAILDEYPPDSLVPGDVLITNDPYKTAGQLLDVTVLVPVFKDERVIAFFGSTIHHTDVGGYGIGAGGRDVFEEGLWIPICKLHVGRRAQPGRVEVHPVQRAPARPHGRRPARPGGVGRGGRAAAARPVRAARPGRHRGPGRRDHRAARRRPPGPRSASCPAAPTGPTPCSTWPTAPASTSTWRSPSTPTPARCSSTTPARPGPARTASTS